jgi:UDP-N-acetylmuramoyl-L-alanyl-D-glutamate--2,6-diaminopimelate ligase
VRIEQVVGSTNTAIEVIAFDSRKVVAFSAFVAVRGTQVDGHAFIEKAIESGASAIICETIPAELKDGVTYVRVEDAAATLGHHGREFLRSPIEAVEARRDHRVPMARRVQPRCCSVCSALLGYKCGLISTVETASANAPSQHAHYTGCHALNELLAEMVEEKVTHCFMEVSSHSVVQERIAGLQFAGGVFTNITHDHLDYHGTFAEYIKAKKRFFDQLPATAFALVNADDEQRGDVAEHEGYEALLRGAQHGRPSCAHHREPTDRPAS